MPGGLSFSICMCVYVLYAFARLPCVCVPRAHTPLIIVQLLVFFPVEQQSEAFSAKALVNNSGLMLFAAVGRNKTGPLNDINGFLP